jgi:hypothetical protein
MRSTAVQVSSLPELVLFNQNSASKKTPEIPERRISGAS